MTRLWGKAAVATAALLAGAASAAPTYVHAGRLIAVPGRRRGPSTIIVKRAHVLSATGL